jgi:hypothetical protein
VSRIMYGIAIVAGLAMAFYSIYKVLKRLSKVVQRTGTRHMLDVHGELPIQAAAATTRPAPPPPPPPRAPAPAPRN